MLRAYGSTDATLGGGKVRKSGRGSGNGRGNNGGGGGGGDPYWASVVSLLHFDGPNGGSILDEKGVAWGNAGNAAISDAQSVFGGASLAVDGTGDYIWTTLASANFQIFGGDFVVEFRFRANANVNNQTFWICGSSATNRLNIGLVSNSIYVYRDVGGTAGTLITAAAPAALGWHGCCFERVGTTMTLYVDGTSVGSSSDTTLPTGATMTMAYGSSQVLVGTEAFAGYIDEARVTKGVSRYNGNYTLATSAFPNS